MPQCECDYLYLSVYASDKYDPTSYYQYNILLHFF